MYRKCTESSPIKCKQYRRTSKRETQFPDGPALPSSFGVPVLSGVSFIFFFLFRICPPREGKGTVDLSIRGICQSLTYPSTKTLCGEALFTTSSSSPSYLRHSHDFPTAISSSVVKVELDGVGSRIGCELGVGTDPDGWAFVFDIVG